MTGRIVIAGGTGFVGVALVDQFMKRGYEVVVLSRGDEKSKARLVNWDGRNVGPWADELKNALAVINLSGTPINKKWTAKTFAEMRSSRIETTNAIGEAITGMSERPKVWVNTNATGIYGDRGDEALSESSRLGTGQLADLCKEWSAAHMRWPLPDVNRIQSRFGVVLGPGGALQVLTKLSTWFLGAPAGTGTQYVSWIHIDDLCSLMEKCVEGWFSGAVNFCAPGPVTNRDLMAGIARQVGRPKLPPVPAPLFEFATGLVGMEGQFILQGQRVFPVIAQGHGFPFKFATIQAALSDLL